MENQQDINNIAYCRKKQTKSAFFCKYNFINFSYDNQHIFRLYSLNQSIGLGGIMYVCSGAPVSPATNGTMSTL